MTLTITFSKPPRTGIDTAVLLVYEGKKLSPAAKSLDKDSGGFITSALKKAVKFTGKSGETLMLSLPHETDYGQALLLGLGKEETQDELKSEIAGGKMLAALAAAGAQKVLLLADKKPEISAHLAAGAKLRAYKFDRYKSKAKDGAKPLTHVYVAGDVQPRAGTLYKDLEKMAEGVYTARDLVNEPPNHLYPEAYALYIQKELKPLGIEVTVLDEKKMEKLGMGAILAVGMGSARKPRMVVMQWKGSGKAAKPVALVGKGVTFDTGGISIKPGAGMEEMKYDMAGSAAVVGAMKTLALRKSKAHVVGIVGLAENMPSSNAYRPGDILKSYSGKTIEVLNTDAEGRLVLADTLTYVQKTYKPRMIIDLATLTGAMLVALGYEYCGTFVNNEKLWQQLEKAGAATGEKIWRMPLDELWKKEMESQIADLQNLGQSGRYAGACTAAGFLEHFIERGTPWAHMDVAGTAWNKKDKPTGPKHASGFGVRILDRLIADHYE